MQILVRSLIAFILAVSIAGSAFANVSESEATATLAAAAAPATVRQEAQRIRWKDHVVKIAVSSSLLRPNANIKSDSDVMGAIRRSFQAWQDVADVQFEIIWGSDKQSVSTAGPAGDGISLITIAASPENVLFFAKDAQTASAKTRGFYNTKSFITEADIVLNPFQQFSTDGTFGTYDLQATLTHEIGHLLGLHHSGVLGATMSDNIPRNGTFGAADFWARTLSDSDSSAIRDLYGPNEGVHDCCAAVSGKLNFVGPRIGKNIRIWAEDRETGRVFGQVDVGGDGSFHLGGLPSGSYNLYWQANTSSFGAPAAKLGSVDVEPGDTKTINQKIAADATDLSLDYIGKNAQLAESGISLVPGTEETVYLGGKGLDPAKLAVGFASPFIHVDRESLISHDFGDGVSVISFLVSVDAEAPAGVYSVFTINDKGSRAAMIGALNVNNPR
jgi:Matrixin